VDDCEYQHAFRLHRVGLRIVADWITTPTDFPSLHDDLLHRSFHHRFLEWYPHDDRRIRSYQRCRSNRNVHVSCLRSSECVRLKLIDCFSCDSFNAACAVAPLFLAPFCELVGRREVFLSAYACFVLIFILLSEGTNITCEIVGRLLSGIFGSCGTILVGGTLADIWNTKDRSMPMSCFTFVAIFGTFCSFTAL